MSSPISMIYRPGKGCRPYVFHTLDEIEAWARRKPYCNETVSVITFLDRREIDRNTLLATDAPAYVSGVLRDATAYQEAATNLAKAVLKQAEQKEVACAFWFISALSKLYGSQPHLKVGDVLQFASEAMPEAAKEWEDYVKNT